MEYEIEDEEVLFDESTNPSLKKKSAVGPHLDAAASASARDEKTAATKNRKRRETGPLSDSASRIRKLAEGQAGEDGGQGGI